MNLLLDILWGVSTFMFLGALLVGIIMLIDDTLRDND